MAGGYVSQHVSILRPHGLEPEWLAYSLFARRTQEALLAGQYGGTKQQLGLDDLAEVDIFLPAQADRQRLLDQLRTSRRGTEAASARLARQVKLLVEHRQALITAAVTGDLEVAA